jgi:predicted MPP superfamily phosphohydrolase
MVGYTSTGAGCSVLPIRFNTRGEVVLLTLRPAPDMALP